MKKGFTLVEIMIVVAIIGLLTAIAIPAFIQYRDDTRAGLCQNNMRLIEHAKGVWAVKNSAATGDPIVKADVILYIKGGAPSCPTTDADTYVYGAVDANPTCPTAGHVLP